MCFSVWSSLYHVKLDIVNKLSLKEETASLGEKKNLIHHYNHSSTFLTVGEHDDTKGLWTECPQREGRSSWDARRPLRFKCHLFHNVISSPLSSFLEILNKTEKEKHLCLKYWNTKVSVSWKVFSTKIQAIWFVKT